MNALALLLVQAAATPPEDAPLPQAPSVEVRAEIRADKLRIEREGEVEVRLEGHPLADKQHRTERNREKGARSYSDLVIRTHAYVTLADPLAVSGSVEKAAGNEPGERPETDQAKAPTIKTGNDRP